jgi:hypothetical protein
MNEVKEPELGRLVPPYPVKRCVLDTCRRELNEEQGVYCFIDLESGKYVFFCGICTPWIELNHSQRFKLLLL